MLVALHVEVACVEHGAVLHREACTASYCRETSWRAGPPGPPNFMLSSNQGVSCPDPGYCADTNDLGHSEMSQPAQHSRERLPSDAQAHCGGQHGCQALKAVQLLRQGIESPAAKLAGMDVHRTTLGACEVLMLAVPQAEASSWCS